MQDTTKDAFEVARFGIDVERFQASQIWRYLMGRAELERDRAINAFKEVDPANTSEVRKIQDAINIPERIVRWLSEAVESGRVAHDMIRAEEAESNE